MYGTLPNDKDTADVMISSSQHDERSSEPPQKRRRLTQLFDDTDDEVSTDGSQASVELPGSTSDEYIAIDNDILGDHRSKYEAVMHEPAFIESQNNVFVTQADQPWSSPSRIRGPRWRKKTPTPSPSPEERSPPVPQTANSHSAKQAADPLIADD